MWLGHSVKRWRWLWFASAVLVMLSSCNRQEPAAGSASPEPRTVLVEMRQTGGLCPSGPCSLQLTVLSGGHWEGARDGSARSGSLSTADRERLAEALAGTALDAPSAPRSGGPCADAADGPVASYSFQRAGNIVSVSSCEREFPPDDPLIAIMEKLSRELLPAR